MLLDVQRAFRATVTSSNDVVAPHVTATQGAVARRMAVYRNNVQKSLSDVLAAAFPVVQRIIGARFFDALARDFVTQHPPLVPQLSLYGADFAGFIATHAQVQHLPYLSDVARLEWARGESYFAADAPPLDPMALSQVGPEQIAALVLSPHPASRLVRSSFPIHRIWSVNQPQVTDVPVVDMSVPENVLISRPRYEVVIRNISHADAVFVTACAVGQNLNDATIAALTKDSNFDLQAALHQHFINGTFHRAV